MTWHSQLYTSTVMVWFFLVPSIYAMMRIRASKARCKRRVYPRCSRTCRARRGQLDLAGDQAICGGDAREAVKALIVANGFLEAEIE